MAPCVLRLKSSIVFHNCVSKKSSGPVQNTEYSPPTGTINVADLEFWIWSDLHCVFQILFLFICMWIPLVYIKNYFNEHDPDRFKFGDRIGLQILIRFISCCWLLTLYSQYWRHLFPPPLSDVMPDHYLAIIMVCRILNVSPPPL